jgi:hypothetical protein
MFDETTLHIASYVLLAFPLAFLAALVLVLWKFRSRRGLKGGFVLLGLIGFVLLLQPLSQVIEPLWELLLYSTIQSSQ